MRATDKHTIGGERFVNAHPGPEATGAERLTAVLVDGNTVERPQASVNAVGHAVQISVGFQGAAPAALRISLELVKWASIIAAKSQVMIGITVAGQPVAQIPRFNQRAIITIHGVETNVAAEAASTQKTPIVHFVALIRRTRVAFRNALTAYAQVGTVAEQPIVTGGLIGHVRVRTRSCHTHIVGAVDAVVRACCSVGSGCPVVGIGRRIAYLAPISRVLTREAHAVNQTEIR